MSKSFWLTSECSAPISGRSLKKKMIGHLTLYTMCKTSFDERLDTD